MLSIQSDFGNAVAQERPQAFVMTKRVEGCHGLGAFGSKRAVRIQGGADIFEALSHEATQPNLDGPLGDRCHHEKRLAHRRFCLGKTL